jgi:hypothetical protein
MDPSLPASNYRQSRANLKEAEGDLYSDIVNSDVEVNSDEEVISDVNHRRVKMTEERKSTTDRLSLRCPFGEIF